MMLVCAICGKKIFTAWPDNWPYRHGGKIFCSENCKTVHAARDLHKIEYIRMDEGPLTGFTPFMFGKEAQKVKYIRPEDEEPAEKTEETEERKEDMRGKPILEENNQKAIEMALDGKDPIAYLKECGAKNPYGNWGYIKMKLQKQDQEKFKQLMEAERKRKGKAAVVEKADKLPEAAGPHRPNNVPPQPEGVQIQIPPKKPEPLDGGEWEKAADDAEKAAKEISKASLNMKITARTKDIEKVIGRPLKSLEYKVIGIETKLGKFQYDAASDQMRWMPRGTAVVVMMPAEDWAKMAEDMPEIMKAIGADCREDEEE